MWGKLLQGQASKCVTVLKFCTEIDIHFARIIFLINSALYDSFGAIEL